MSSFFAVTNLTSFDLSFFFCRYSTHHHHGHYWYWTTTTRAQPAPSTSTADSGFHYHSSWHLIGYCLSKPNAPLTVRHLTYWWFLIEPRWPGASLRKTGYLTLSQIIAYCGAPKPADHLEEVCDFFYQSSASLQGCILGDKERNYPDLLLGSLIIIKNTIWNTFQYIVFLNVPPKIAPKKSSRNLHSNFSFDSIRYFSGNPFKGLSGISPEI